MTQNDLTNSFFYKIQVLKLNFIYVTKALCILTIFCELRQGTLVFRASLRDWYDEVCYIFVNIVSSCELIFICIN